VDAITLSRAELADAQGGVAPATAAVAVVLAAVSNTIVKGGIALSLGSKALRRALLPPFGAMLVTAVVVAFLYV
jgi:uncharacterized membrane protein (DUF4010 family)